MASGSDRRERVVAIKAAAKVSFQGQTGPSLVVDLKSEQFLNVLQLGDGSVGGSLEADIPLSN